MSKNAVLMNLVDFSEQAFNNDQVHDRDCYTGVYCFGFIKCLRRACGFSEEEAIVRQEDIEKFQTILLDAA